MEGMCVDKIFSSQLEIKKSQFISYILPYSEFKSTLTRLKEEHTKAVHFVYAYRYLNDHQQLVENLSDDGEPKGSSGRPTLNVLIGHQLLFTAIITVRYFGGTKLGVGGLVRAYSDSANFVIRGAELKPFIPKISLIFEIPYPELNHVEYILKHSSWISENKEFNALSVKWRGQLSLSEWKAKEGQLATFLLFIA